MGKALYDIPILCWTDLLRYKGDNYATIFLFAAQIGCKTALYLCIVNQKEVWVSGRNQRTANAPSPMKRAPKVRIFLLPLDKKLGCRIAAIASDCNSLVFRLRRFESCHPNAMLR